MRKLGLIDAFAAARLIKKADLKTEIAALATEVQARQAKGEALKSEDLGLKFVINVISALSSKDIEDDFYKIYADVKGVGIEDVSTTDFTTLKADIKEIIEQNDLKGFFRSASLLM